MVLWSLDCGLDICFPYFSPLQAETSGYPKQDLATFSWSILSSNVFGW